MRPLPGGSFTRDSVHTPPLHGAALSQSTSHSVSSSPSPLTHGSTFAPDSVDRSGSRLGYRSTCVNLDSKSILAFLSANSGILVHIAIQFTQDAKQRANNSRPLTDADQEANRRKSSARSKVEHPFLTLKRIWGFAKTRYRGMAKNANRAFAMLAMINLRERGRPLTAEGRPACLPAASFFDPPPGCLCRPGSH